MQKTNKIHFNKRFADFFLKDSKTIFNIDLIITTIWAVVGLLFISIIGHDLTSFQIIFPLSFPIVYAICLVLNSNNHRLTALLLCAIYTSIFIIVMIQIAGISCNFHLFFLSIGFSALIYLERDIIYKNYLFVIMLCLFLIYQIVLIRQPIVDLQLYQSFLMVFNGLVAGLIICIKGLTYIYKYDVTKTKLSSNKKSYHDLFENSSVGTLVTNTIYLQPKRVNEKFANLFGIKKEEVFDEKYSFLFDFKFHETKNYTTERLKKIVKEYNKNRITTIFDWKLKRVDNTMFDCNISITPLYDDDQFLSFVQVSDKSELNRYKKSKQIDEQKYKAILENVFDGIIYESAHDSLPRYCNQNFLNLFEIKEEEVQSFDLEDYFPNFQPDGKISREKYKHIYKRFKLNNYYLQFDWVFKSKNNNEINAEVTLARTKSKDTITVIRNKNNELNAQKSLTETKHLYNTLFDNSIDGIEIMKIHTETHEILDYRINEPFRNILLYEADELKNKSTIDISPAYQSNGLKTEVYYKSIVNKFIRDNRIQYEWDLINKNGKVITVEISSVREVKDKTASVFSIFKDITNIKKTEQALIRSERLYRTLFSNIYDGIEIYVEDSKTNEKISQFTNQKLRELFKLKNGKDDSFKFSNYFPEKQRDGRLSSICYEETRKELAANNSLNREWSFLNEENELFICNLFVVKFYDNDTINTVTILKDITEKVNQENVIEKQIQELNKKNNQLEKYINSNLQLENFAYMASHDLKAPIRSIVGFSQLLSNSAGKKLNENEIEYLNFIVNSSNNMQMLIEDLLNYARVNNSERKISKVNISKTLKSVLLEMSSSIEEKSAVVNLTSLPELIYADEIKMKMLFQNLIANGIKFHKKNIEPIIEIAANENDDYWEFSITDNGIGIENEYLDKIFLLFRKLHNSQDYQGTGIGLATCKKITELHQGEIWVESKPDIGSTFYFTIAKKLKLKD